jgi:hypothetical protein
LSVSSHQPSMLVPPLSARGRGWRSPV